MGESKTLDVLHPYRTHDFLAPAESGGREAWTRLSLRPLKLATLHCYQHAVVPRNGPPDEPLWFEKPEVRKVQEMETGRHLPVAAVMGSDYERLAQLRMNVRSQMRKDEPLYWRSLFNVAVVHLHQYPVIVVQGRAAA